MYAPCTCVQVRNVYMLLPCSLPAPWGSSGLDVGKAMYMENNSLLGYPPIAHAPIHLPKRGRVAYFSEQKKLLESGLRNYTLEGRDGGYVHAELATTRSYIL